MKCLWCHFVANTNDAFVLLRHVRLNHRKQFLQTDWYKE